MSEEYEEEDEEEDELELVEVEIFVIKEIEVLEEDLMDEVVFNYLVEKVWCMVDGGDLVIVVILFLVGLDEYL